MVSSNSSSISIFKLLYDDILRVESCLLTVKKNRLMIKLYDYKNRVKSYMMSDNPSSINKTGLLFILIFVNQNSIKIWLLFLTLYISHENTYKKIYTRINRFFLSVYVVLPCWLL